ncbi:SLBB domain-containing protein [bacterium]|nr:SLBB domain-containing protein [bacterium]
MQPQRLVGWIALAMMIAQPGLAVAQTAGGDGGTLKPGDEISISVPGRPELSQQFTLNAEGAVEISPVGAVQLGGLTQKEAQVLLKQRLRLFYPTLDTVEIKVAHSGSVRIYILGGVSQRGVLNFASDPTIWEVLRMVGGPMENADLAGARVIRQTGKEPEVHELDLSGVLEGTKFVDFELRDGDTLVIPILQKGVPGTAADKGVKVFGSVGLPTVVPISEGTPMLDVLMRAGAPTENAKKSEINWVHDTGVRIEAKKVDLEAFLQMGDPAGNPLVYPGDTLHVEFQKPSWFKTNLAFVLGTLAAVATIALTYYTIKND